MRGSLRTRILIFALLSVAAVIAPGLLRDSQEREQANVRVEMEALQRALRFKLDTLRGHLSSYQFSLGVVRTELDENSSQFLLANATNNFLTLTQPELKTLPALIERQSGLSQRLLGQAASSLFAQNARLESTFRQIGPIADTLLESFGSEQQRLLEQETLAEMLQLYRASIFDLDEALQRENQAIIALLDETRWSYRFIEVGIYLAWFGSLGLLIGVLRLFGQLKEESYLTSLLQGKLPSEFVPLQIHFQRIIQRQAELTRRLEAVEGDIQRANQSARRTENDLSLERLFVRNLLNNLRAAVFVTDHLGRVDFTNRRAREIGQSTDWNKTNKLWEALEAKVGLSRSIIDDISQSRLPYHSSSVRISVADGEYVFELTVSPHISPTGDILQFIWLLDDITEEVAAKHQLLQSEHLAAMGRISTQVAHEIRNPLSAINLNAELIQAELSDLMNEFPNLSKLGHAEESLSAMIREIERLEKVTETYLQLSRMPSPNARPIDLIPILTDLMQMYEVEWQTQTIRASLDYESQSLPVLLDEGLFRQAMINILKNAAEAMPNGGSLGIRAEQSDTSTTIEVVDEGSGCSEEDIKRAFEPFFTTKSHGTGLGLHLTKQIVQDQGGSLTFTKNDGIGMTMKMSFPIGRTL